MRHLATALALAVLSALPAHAAGIGLGPGFTTADLRGLTDALGDALTFPNLGPAAPTGITGFEVLAAAGGPQVDTGAHWWHEVDGSTVGGVFYAQRLIVRKGLPANLDAGVQVGEVLGQRFWGGEFRWALLEGSTVSPAAALRATYTRRASSRVAADVADVQIVVSKGFVVVTPYAALGYRRVSADVTFGSPVAASHSATAGRWIGAVGARVKLLPVLRLVGEFRQGANRSVYVGLGVGL